MKPLPIAARIAQPTPEEVRAARIRADLTQAEAAQLVSPAEKTPYRSWQNYEVPVGQTGYRAIPLASWELFLLLTDQHQGFRLVRKKGQAPAP